MWTGESSPIFTKDTHMRGGFSDKHITPVHSVGGSCTAYSGSPPICWSHNDNTGCLKVTPEDKRAYGEAKVAKLTGFGEVTKHIHQTVVKNGPGLMT